MQSIITFKEDEKNEDEEKKNTNESIDNLHLVNKRKRSNSNEGVKEKKIKKETLKVVSLVANKNNKKKKKKDKHKKSDIDSEQKNSSFEISDSENNLRTMINENIDSSIEKSVEIMSSDDVTTERNIESNNDCSKKKRKRNKGKKVKSDTNITSSELRIMSKYITIFIN